MMYKDYATEIFYSHEYNVADEPYTIRL